MSALEDIRKRHALGLHEINDTSTLLSMIEDMELRVQGSEYATREFAREVDEYRKALDDASTVAAQACAMLERVEPVVVAAREVKRGCDCGYDYRCVWCSKIVSLQEAIAKMDGPEENAS